MSVSHEKHEKRFYTVPEFAEEFGHSARWGYQQVEKGRIEARTSRFREPDEDFGGGDQPVLGRGVVQCQSWRSRDDGRMSVLDRIDPDSLLGKAVKAAYIAFLVGCVSGIIPGLIIGITGIQP